MSARTSRVPDLPITFGKFVLRERIGKGGMAEIFRATAQGASGFQKELVIKRMLPSLTDDPGFADVIVREAKIAVTLRHQNIVQVFELGEVDGQYYIAMEYIHGRDLRAVLARSAEQASPLPIGLACFVAMEVCKALDYSHAVKDVTGKPLELVHRDISPTNLMASFAGEVKVLDFGIAKAEVSEYVTREGLIKGNCPYMSPEQIAGQAVNQQSDIFSLGSTLYELLTGRRSFEAPSQIAIMQRIYAEPPIPPRQHRPEIPEKLEALVLTMLEKDRTKRIADAAAAHHGLAELVGREVPASSSFELSRFLLELFGEDSLRESRSLPPEGETNPAQSVPILPVSVGGLDTIPQRRPDVGTPPLRIETPSATAEPALPGERPRVTTRPLGERGSAAPRAGSESHTRRLAAAAGRVPAMDSGHRLWAVPALMLLALVGYLLWPRSEPAPRYEPTPDRVDRARSAPPRLEAPPTRTAIDPLPAIDEPVVATPDPPTKRRTPVAMGRLRLSSEPWATVTIDGRRINKPTPLADYPVPAGTRVVTLSHPGYKTVRRTVRVPANDAVLVRVVLERL